MKKSLSLLVAIAMVFSMFASVAFAAEEPTTTAKYEELVKAGIFAGLPGGEAGLDQTMTRAQAAVIIAKLAGYKAGVTSPDAGFTDVPAGHWAKPYVDFAANLGIISGLGNGTFAPSADVTKQELAKLSVDALVKLGYKLKDAVAVEGTVADWAKEYVGKAIANGIFAAQADYTVPALRELLVTATYTAYVALQVPSAIVVESVKATNSKTLVATFNVEVGTATANDFTVTTKDDVYAINVVDGVSVDGKTVKITLVDALDEETTYVLTSNGVTSKENNLVLASTTNEVKYVATEAASIAFGATTVKHDSTVPVVIKDAAGNDITANFDLSDAITIESSDTGVVSDTDLKAINPVVNTSEYSVVNVKLNDTKFETGNTIITVKNTLAVASKIGVVTVADDFGSEDLNLFKSTPDVLIAQVLDQDGTDITGDLAIGDITYRSQNPTVAVVDETTGAINGVKAGTATILVKAVYNGKTVSKTVTVTVKADAELTSIQVELPGSKLVKDSNITQDLKVKLIDQYGNPFKVTDVAGQDVVFTITKNGIVELSGVEFEAGAANAETLTIAQGASDTTLVLEPGQVKGSGSIKVVVGSLSKSVSVALVEAGAFAGYVAVAGDTTLDVEQKDPANAENPVTTTISVYKKDVNGNYIDTVTTGIDLDVAADSAVSVDDATQTVAAEKVGTANVTVLVNSAKIATIKFTTVKTKETLTKVSQAKNAITIAVAGDLETALFGGVDGKGGAFVGYDQYGTVSIINPADVDAFSSNKNIVDTDFDVLATGTATLTLDINGTLYTITVKVV